MHLLIELRRLIERIPPGSTVYLTATDPAAPLDLAAWCHFTGHHYLGPVSTTARRTTYAIKSDVSARRACDASPWCPGPSDPDADQRTR
ncbi:sulfurtransferase TusA family protein [Phytoactinopolyspora alkaliphila]|uniref:sulfurtransferase TusA family protein n=1 Tax=Phytoactinopolyspora alkaliphila TaxID=1783498 RepID=UPI001C205574|nr:sulfurtransferase TusA family protein [Phytoactinopolyspora alkaliphila]